MRRNPVPGIESGRLRVGPYGTPWSSGPMGAFKVKAPSGSRLIILASDGAGWEHVSVSVEGEERTPTWEEMAFVKEGFWKDEETVMQLHVPKRDHINLHEGCLHLWRPLLWEIPRPSSLLVGPGGSS
jgi:hypothetical protein